MARGVPEVAGGREPHGVREVSGARECDGMTKPHYQKMSNIEMISEVILANKRKILHQLY